MYFTITVKCTPHKFKTKIPANKLISSICGDLTLAGVVRLEWLRPLAVSGFCRRGLLGTNRPLRFTASLHLPQGAHRRFTRSRSACREFIKYINPYKNKKRCLTDIFPVLAGVVRLELTARGFGDRCSTN